MPQLPFARHAHQLEASDEMVGVEPGPTCAGGLAPAQQKLPRRRSILDRWRKGWRKHAELPDVVAVRTRETPDAVPPLLRRRSSNPELRPKGSKRAIASLPRQQTLKRSESEKRGKLEEVPSSEVEKRRGWSASAFRRTKSPKPGDAPEGNVAHGANGDYGAIDGQISRNDSARGTTPAPSSKPSNESLDARIKTTTTEHDNTDNEHNDEDDDENIDPEALQEEYSRRWILNLSMSFRDKSQREKFFVTYAETPTKWRRLTISLDYRTAPEGSLEADLRDLRYQRDKSFRIFEAIRESLDDIQYYDTVTNLKLETTEHDCQLHIHVREDANEIVEYPSASLMEHVDCRRFRESDVEFDSHISGFVYKVRVGNQILIKKEIPGPDTVDEFLYEVNALDALYGTNSVVQLQGLITDEDGSLVKGLLISYAARGALVDMLYDFPNALPWQMRLKWAYQIVEGLSDIHEAGFVQGDFTLSNIVIDSDDNAQIIDINRRGCPVGWEPPELSKLIDSGQRIAMHISVKTDLYQLGMVLWALAAECDEPEHARPLTPLPSVVPSFYQRIVNSCLEERPQKRMSAHRLLDLFPPDAGSPTSARSVEFASKPSVFNSDVQASDHSLSTAHRSDKEYIDPAMAVTLDEVQRRRERVDSAKAGFKDQVTYLDPDSTPASTSYHIESSGSWIVPRSRGRSPVSSRRRRSSPYGRTATSVTSLSLSPDRHSGRYSAKVYCDDTEDDASYPTQLDDRDLAPPPRSDSRSTGRQLSPAGEKRVARPRSSYFGPPMHQDSGFDEQMLGDLQARKDDDDEDESSSDEEDTASESETTSEAESPQLRPKTARVMPSHGALAAAAKAFAR